jgi:hypothetical protein
MFMRNPEGAPQRDRRRFLVLVAGGLGIGYLLVTGLATAWTDFLWFKSVGFTGVWWVNTVSVAALGAAGFLFVFLLVWANLGIADRLSPRHSLLAQGEGDEVVERFRSWVEPRLRWVRLAVATAVGLLVGVGAARWRDLVLPFLNPSSFRLDDPQFGTDLSFYLFRLPFWSVLTSWLFNVVAVTLVIAAAFHYLNGGIRFEQGSRFSVRPGVKAHLSVLAAVLALIRAVAYRIDSYELVYAPNSVFGAGYTDVNARLPALNLLALVSLVAAVLFLLNITRPGWTLAIVSVGSWLFVSLAAGAIYPAVVERFQVQPNKLARERPYIERNIAATRAAFGLDSIEVVPYSAEGTLSAEDIEANRPIIDNLRLWNRSVLTRTYQQDQEIRPFYGLDKVDTDRYVLDGVPTQVMLAVRELDEVNLPATGWQPERLIYTHGYGAVLNAANQVGEGGEPELLLRDMPPVTESPEIELDQPRSYFGESYQPGRPVIVRTGPAPQEVDYPLGNEIVENEYDGPAGVSVGGFFRRLAFALRYRDLNLLISSQLRDDSRILIERNIRSMVGRVTPFLAADADPYPVLLDGRVVWVLDLYTSSSRYPYSQPVLREDTLRMARGSGLPPSGFNYVRNSVKATIDAHDGTLRYYVVDPSDPVAATLGRIYPDLFLDAAELPPGLVEHLRYPQDLFKIQGEMYLDYHMVNADDFFRRSDAWSIPRDPSTIRRSELLWGDDGTGTQVAYLDKLLPYYLLTRLPGEEDLSYALVQPFSPLQKPNMSAVLVADSSPGRYGRLIEYRLPSGTLVEGTGQVGIRIEQNDEFSSQFTLWRGQGSTVLMGDMLVVPIDDAIFYVQPVYLEAQTGGRPQLRRVVVVYGDRVEWDDTLDGALSEVFGSDTGIVEPPEEGEPTGDVQALLEQAADAFERARAALAEGDLGLYQDLVEEAQRLVEQALSQVQPVPDARVRSLVYA